jgi:hypothetical protein
MTTTSRPATSEERKMNLRSRSRALAAAVALFCASLLVLAGGASAAYEHIVPGFDEFQVVPSDPQAGGHPNVEIDYQYRQDHEGECESQCLFARRLILHWPEGFIGNPHVAPKCKMSEFSASECPVDAQIGKVVINFFGPEIYVPFYNMETRPDQAGLLGFTAPLLGLPILVELGSRTDSDYGLEATQSDTMRLPFNKFRIELWGVPADPVNDVDRFFTPLTGVAACYIGIFGPEIVGCPPGLPFVSPTYAPATVPPAPFLQNPTVCGTSLTMTGEVEYYGGSRGSTAVPWPETTGCAQASFNPSVTAKPTTEETDTASGLDTLLKVPQTQSPITPSPSQMKATRVTLPQGFSINPGASDGKVACPETATAIGTLLGSTCPENSKIGSLSLDVAALPAPIPGNLYLAEPKPGDPYRILLTASGFATNVKLLGSVKADPVTGQLSIVFEHLPQSPLQAFDMHVFGSERGLLATPTHCGNYQVESEFVPWNSALNTRTSLSSIALSAGPNGQGCPGARLPFAPSLEAGSENSTAGMHAPFNLVLKRRDGDQSVKALDVTMPPGFAATLKGIPYCPESAIQALASAGRKGADEKQSPACPGASQIGTVVAGVGAGTHPLFTPGKVFLAGPYKGAPLSLVVAVPAVSGPYDLGNVAVRSAITVDPVTAQVSIQSDPLPQILQGILLRLRSVQLSIDRKGFALNPTNCDRFAVNATAFGAESGQWTETDPYQVANCADLPFAPKLNLKLKGGTNRRGHPALDAVLTANSGESNIGKVVVTMPHSMLLDNAHINAPCTRVQYAANSCPPSSQLGTARAFSPLLDKPLEGPVYLRSSSHGLPDLVAKLDGLFQIELVGRIDSVRGRLRATFGSVPDVPVSRFTMSLAGGKKGLLQNSVNLCKRTQRSTVKMVGQNGRQLVARRKLQVACGGSVKHKRSAHRRPLAYGRAVR